MIEKNTGIYRIIMFLLSCVVLCGVCFIDISATPLEENKHLTLDLKELNDNNLFSYKILPWDTQKEDVEEILDISLGAPMYVSEDETQTSFLLKNGVEYSEYTGDLFLDFNEDLTQIGFHFFSDKVKEIDKVSEQILDELISLYGEFLSCNTLENTVTGDGETVMYRWENSVQDSVSGENAGASEKYKNSCLELHLDYNDDQELLSILVYLFYTPTKINNYS